MYLVFLFSAALVLYFNCEPQFDPSEIKLPLPCDDAAWDATTSDECACALGLNGPDPQTAVNRSGSLRAKQLEMHLAIKALYSPTATFQPRTTNAFSKFILVHALLVQIWRLQRQSSTGVSLGTSTPPVVPLPQDHGLYPTHPPHAVSGHSSPDLSSASGPVSFQSNKPVVSMTTALIKWKKTWDEDMPLQYPPSQNPTLTPRRHGFCRDGIHFYWLACSFLSSDRVGDWKLPADIRFKQVMSGLRQARDFGKSYAAQRGEEPGSVGDIDNIFHTEALELDMKKLFRPIGDVW